LDTNAVANGNIRLIGEQYADGANVAKAYIKHNILLAALYANTIYQNQAYHLLHSNLLLQNNNEQTVTKVELKIGNKPTVYNFIKDKSLPYTFTEAGPVNLQFTIYLSNGSTKVINQTLNITAVKKSRAALDPNLCPLIVTNITGRTYMQPDNVANNFGAIVDVGFYRHFSGAGNCDTMLSKPVIFIDGYDDKSTRSIGTIYEENMSFLNPLNPLDSLRVGDSLRHQGHDIFIFNPRMYIDPSGNSVDGGTDYIERNAYALEVLIQQINQRLAWQGSTDSLIIVGPSMGGQISRYALADMERAGTPHRCKLWVSFDSPHHGANIAPGIQAFIKFMAQISPDAKETLELSLITPAAREQIIHQTQLGGNVNDVAYNNTSYDRIRWMDTLALLGFPTQCKKVTIASGHGNGGTFHTAGNTIFQFRAKTRNWVTWATAFFTPFAPIPPFLFSHAKIHINAYYFPAYNTTSTVFEAKAYLKRPYKKPFKQKVTHNGTNTLVYGCLDGTPGGNYNLPESVYEAADTSSIQISSFPLKTFHMTFIPTWSALAFNNPNDYWAKPIVPLGDLVCNNLIPFEAYIYQPTNERHTLINANTYRFMRQHARQQTHWTQCAKICAKKILATAVSTTPYICIGDTKQYHLDVNLPTLPSLSYTTWSSSSGLSVTPIDNNNCSITAVPTASYFEELTANIHNTCDTDIVIKQKIWIGDLAPTNTYEFSTIYLGCQRYVYLVPKPGSVGFPVGTTFKWSKDDITYYSAGTPTIANTTLLCIKNDQPLYCKIYTNCGGYFGKVYGLIPKATLIASACACKQDMGSYAESPLNFSVSIYPNPAQDFWNVEVLDFVKAESADCSLVDLTGKVMWSKHHEFSNFSNISVPAKDLPKGIYILKLQSERQNSAFKLIKE
jgi:Secretion system C-terminal sorting domain